MWEVVIRLFQLINHMFLQFFIPLLQHPKDGYKAFLYSKANEFQYLFFIKLKNTPFHCNGK